MNRFLRSERRDELLASIGCTNDDGDTLLHACAQSLDQRDETSQILDPLLIQIMKNLLDMGIENTANNTGTTPRDMCLAAGIKQRELNEVLPEKQSTASLHSGFSFKVRGTATSAPKIGDESTFGSIDGQRL